MKLKFKPFGFPFLIVLTSIVFFVGLTAFSYSEEESCIPCQPTIPGRGSGETEPVSGGEISLTQGDNTIVFFHIPGCESCQHVDSFLRRLNESYPFLKIIKEDMSSREKMELRGVYDRLYGVPDHKRGIVPAVFIGEEALVGRAKIERELEEKIKRGIEGKASSKSVIRVKSSDVKNDFIARFKSFSLLAVSFAGLIDGINPCAFATLIFFVSYLSFTGRKGRELFAIGISFIIAVFLTYLLIGLGLFKFLNVLKSFQIISKIIYLITGLIALLLGIYNISDYFKARRGNTRDMTLQLPKRLKGIIHSIIRRQVRTRYIVVVAAFTGFLISLFEFACTGQVYLPTIVYIIGIPNYKAIAIFYLILYNVMFVIPLFLIFVVVSTLGVTSQRIGDLFAGKIPVIKLATAGFFLFLSGYMFFISAQVFGLI